MQEGDQTEVQELTFQFSNLQINIRVSVTPTSGVTASGSGDPVVTSSVTHRGPQDEEYHEHFPFTEELEEQTLAAATPGQLAELPLVFLRGLESRLRGGDPSWTSRARLARAFRAGLAARLRLDGITCPVASPSIPFRNSYYIILRSPDLPRGGWTSDYGRFIARTGRSYDRDFSSTCVCHAFATRTEVEAYLVGSRRVWPPQIQ